MSARLRHGLENRMFLLAWQRHELASQPDATVGVHGADPAHVPSRIIEAAEELGAEEPDLDAELVQPQVALPRRVPEPVQLGLGRLRVGPHVRERGGGGLE